MKESGLDEMTPFNFTERELDRLRDQVKELEARVKELSASNVSALEVTARFELEARVKELSASNVSALEVTARFEHGLDSEKWPVLHKKWSGMFSSTSSPRNLDIKIQIGKRYVVINSNSFKQVQRMMGLVDGFIEILKG